MNIFNNYMATFDIPKRRAASTGASTNFSPREVCNARIMARDIAVSRTCEAIPRLAITDRSDQKIFSAAESVFKISRVVREGARELISDMPMGIVMA